jgi:D-lactate dehydrogenase
VALLEPKINMIRPVSGGGRADRVPDALAHGTPEPLLSGLTREVGENRVLSRVIDLVRYATDASPYRLVPQAVVVAQDVADVSAVMRFAAREGRHAVQVCVDSMEGEPAGLRRATMLAKRHTGCVIGAASRITVSAAHRLHCRRMGGSRAAGSTTSAPCPGVATACRPTGGRPGTTDTRELPPGTHSRIAALSTLRRIGAG